MWLSIMRFEADQGNSKTVIMGMGWAYCHLFSNEYKKLMDTNQPHPNFEKFRPAVEKIMRSKMVTASLPPSDPDGFYSFGDVENAGMPANEMFKTMGTLKGRHKKSFEETGLYRWMDIGWHAW